MSERIDIKIGGLVRFSTLDYPGLISAVIFCQGCPNRCVYCHNQTLIWKDAVTEIQFGDIVKFLQSRQGLLDAVVFSGGEPLVQPGLNDAMTEVKALGYKIGIHTSGYSARLLRTVLDDVDWVGLDVKAPKAKYARIVGRDISAETFKCIKIIQEMSTDYEIRTTYDSDNMREDDLIEMSNELRSAGIKDWVIQRCIKYKNGRRFDLGAPGSHVLDRISNSLRVKLR